ncbi:hypothetical protein [Thiococcus pfennigii]|jgi:nickel transport protein|uniref:hypothetical protein n=1 Tax=Thiococcus pfennigii TaxID=1057 RepID=UPI00190627EF|nr:hypothetical protein [Thiococcus pfennigii]MBK1702109.1 hypothetical protein [Thiococcus pfennigii]MBK1730383.1 hypothetical protein [Thiococcus pfennigii]
MIDKRLALACLLLATATPLHAHLLKVFAFAEGERIEGRAYFAGGARAKGAAVEVLAPDGRVLAALRTDDDGEFSYQANAAIDHRIRVDSGDGHVAEWTVPATELEIAAPAAGDPDRPAAPTESTPEATPAETAAASVPATESPGDLEVLIERAVARQVRPLREQLVAYEEQVRLHDILGGLGYILGLAGLAAWWQASRRRGR